MISMEDLVNRKEGIEGDIKKVEDAISSLDSQRTQLQANLFALQGALQQVEFFIGAETSKEEENKDE